MSMLKKEVEIPPNVSSNETLDGFRQGQMIEQGSQPQLMQTKQHDAATFNTDLKGIKQEGINYVVNF
ncbi:MAG: hypothetical protein L3J70_11720 [Gammaproteobacteria bacterium]|nr:hypothetical protein [Gammaproteobacteria bacterium]